VTPGRQLSGLPGDLASYHLPDLGAGLRRAGLVAPDQLQQDGHLPVSVVVAPLAAGHALCSISARCRSVPPPRTLPRAVPRPRLPRQAGHRCSPRSLCTHATRATSARTLLVALNAISGLAGSPSGQWRRRAAAPNRWLLPRPGAGHHRDREPAADLAAAVAGLTHRSRLATGEPAG
jgi:hypothetical protein